MQAPILSLDDAVAAAEAWRRDGKKIVAVSGSFDILHAGHHSLISEARAAGDALVVLLNSDISVRAYKGPSRPLNRQDDRAANVAALPGVDVIVLFDELVPLAAIARLKPDVLANGPDYGADCIEKPLVQSYGGYVLVTSARQPDNSTSQIARRHGAAQNPRAILFDRDGTLIEDPGYLSRPEQVVWKEGAMAALSRLQAAGFLLIIVTNQSGIGRGMFSVDDMEAVHRRIRDDLAKENIRLAGIYHCPHGPDEGCDCRKPETGLLLQAARDHRLDLSKSWMVGDKCSDVLAGLRTNMRTILVYSDANCVPVPHSRAPTLGDAAALILEQA